MWKIAAQLYSYEVAIAMKLLEIADGLVHRAKAIAASAKKFPRALDN